MKRQAKQYVKAISPHDLAVAGDYGRSYTCSVCEQRQGVIYVIGKASDEDIHSMYFCKPCAALIGQTAKEV